MALDIGELYGTLTLDASSYKREAASADLATTALTGRLDELDARRIDVPVSTGAPEAIVPVEVLAQAVAALRDVLIENTAVTAAATEATQALAATQGESTLAARANTTALAENTAALGASGEAAAAAGAQGAEGMSPLVGLIVAGVAAGIALGPALATALPVVVGLGAAVGVVALSAAGLGRVFTPLADDVKRLQAPITAIVTSGLAPMVAELGGTLVPVLRTGLSAVAGGLNAVIAGLLGFASAPATLSGLTSIMSAFGSILTNDVAPALPAILGVLLQLATAALPGLQQLATAFSGVATSAQAALAGLPVGQLSGLISGAVTLLLGLLSTVGQIVGAILPALAAVGGPLVAALSPLGSIVAQLAPLLLTMAQGVGQLLGVVAGLLPLLGPVASLLSEHATAVTAVAAAVAVLVAGWKTYQVIAGIATAAQAALNAVLDANPIGIVVLALAALTAGLIYAYQHSEAFRDVVNGAWGAVRAGIGDVVGWITGTAVPFVVGAWDKISGGVSTMVGAIRDHWQLILSILTGPIGAAVIAIVGHWNTITSTAAAIPGKIKAAFAGAASLLVGIGGDIINGLVKGIEAGASKVASAAKSIADHIPSVVKDILDIHSPSKVMYDVGLYVNQGLADGLTGTSSQVTSAITTIAKDVNDVLTAQLSEAAQNAIDAARARVDAAQAAVSVAKKTKDKADDAAAAQRLSAANAALAAAEAQMDGVAAKAAANATAFMRGEQAQLTSLQSIAAAKVDTATQLTGAQKALTDAQKTESDYASQLTQSAVSVGSLAQILQNATQDGGNLSAAGLVAGLQQGVSALSTFQSDLDQLKSAGVSQDVLKQISDAGVTVGTQLAQVLLQGGPQIINQVNVLTSAIGSGATALGNAAAKDLYGAGVQAAQGLVQGLQSQEAALTAEAVKLAGQVSAAVKKALDIHSPSRVMAALGVQVPAGLAVGIAGNTAVASAAARSMAGAVAAAGAPVAIPGAQAFTRGDGSLADRVTGGAGAGVVRLADEDRALLTAATKRPVQLVTDRGTLLAEVNEGNRDLKRQGVSLP